MKAMADDQFLRFVLAIVAGVATFAVLSYLTGGWLPFLEFALAGAVVYLIARR